MTSSRVLRGIIATAFCLTFVSAVRADSAHGENLRIEKLIFAERHLDLSILDDQRIDTGYLYAGHFENNNGKHLGFSLAAVRQGPRFSLLNPPQAPSVSENPEPTAMVLLGTGLAAIGAFARKLNRRRKS